MSLRDAQAFLFLMQQDPAFATAVSNAASDEERCKLVAATGFTFTPDELKTIMATHGPGGKLLEGGPDALSDSILASFAMPGSMPEPTDK